MPTKHDLFITFGLILFFVHSWAIYRYLYEIPSFLLYMNITQIISIFAYMMAFAFIESILTCTIISGLCSILPVKNSWVGFVPRAFCMLIVAILVSINFMDTLPSKYPGLNFLLFRMFIAAGIFIILLLIIYFLKPVQRFVVFVAEQVSVMVYIFTPIGVISIFVVLFRILI